MRTRRGDRSSDVRRVPPVQRSWREFFRARDPYERARIATGVPHYREVMGVLARLMPAFCWVLVPHRCTREALADLPIDKPLVH